MALARELFLTIPDMPALLALFVAVANRNVETIKELPVAHRILEERAVELRVVKRRRGQKRWYETVSWEIGKPGRELHTPGGLYLLALELTARSRAFSGARFLWSVWRSNPRANIGGVAEHDGMFDRKLNRNIYATEWAETHGLTADRVGSPEPVEAAPAARTRTIKVDGRWVRRKPAPGTLQVEFNRLKTSTDVRRTKQAGGHLPSSVRTNTIPTLFRSYLRDDPTTIEWAEDVVSAALVDAEHSALDAHRRVLDANGGSLRVVPGPADAQHLRDAGLDPTAARKAAAGELDTVWTACVDPDHHPASGEVCRPASFLDCFHCGNCLVTRDQLPAQLGLLDALGARREQLSEQDWWGRYGSVWAAITNDILVKFSAAEIELAQAAKPDDALLDLLENPWEHP
ncbi:hypothetical protein BAY61_32315 (plasmid) [Prauserella marina]|uniref:Uncharacterized protein n=1 Tax=Prauserella marina TaxID=530584 RepID=A0A222W186_9PSEU|nr:hypothetical protein [Prauserella marina]ASR39968.1 hypothetical protein BAY61_32315 [Prauserella marina]PWV71305.1 hypothetical protein DES30_11221 [Prauserella marina]SDD96934.1 hypothetical protein SAMN05421630_11591 [Prauserella marina]